MRGEGGELLRGTIELDETYIGGKVRRKGKGYRGNKTIVVGAVQRGGEIRLKVIGGRDSLWLRGFIRRQTHDEADVFDTHEWSGYDVIADKNTRHERVNHRAGQYVYGNVHTNSVENVWSLLKRSIVGSFHKVSVKHLDRYLDELEWRFNNRENPFLFRDTLRRMIHSDSLEYKALTA